jgi:hypothetical protein
VNMVNMKTAQFLTRKLERPVRADVLSAVAAPTEPKRELARPSVWSTTRLTRIAEVLWCMCSGRQKRRIEHDRRNHE